MKYTSNFIKEHVLEEVHMIKYFGTVVGYKLTWTFHTDFVRNKIASGLLRKISIFCNQQAI